jgi:lysophospholipase L1-like esterase
LNRQQRVALLEFGGNDCNFDWPAVAADPGRDYEPATPVDVFRNVYGEVILSLRDQGYTPVLLTLPPLDAQRYFDWFTRDGLDRDAILFWLGDVQFIYRWHEGYNDIVWEVAMNYDCPVIDIRANFLKQKHVSSLLCMDGIHPNRAGHKLIEKAILEHAASYTTQSMLD